MAKVTGLGDRLYIDGNNVSGDVGSLGSIHGGGATIDVTSIDRSAFERIGGQRDGGLDFAAWFNDDAGRGHSVLKTLPTTDRFLTYLRGTALGGHAACLLGKQINYDLTRSDSGEVSLAISADCDGFGIEWGEQHTAGARTDTTPTNGTGVDGNPTGASTTFGFQAYLHVTNVVGTSVTVKLQESSDNGGGDAFVDVVGGAFAAVTPGGAPSAQRIAASPANLERYLRVVTTGTFTSATFVVVVVRNLTAVVF